MYLAQNIQYLRTSANKSQADFAECIGVSSGAVGMWEIGKREPDLKKIIKIAEFFGVSLDDLILHELKPPIPLYVSNIRYLRKKHDMTQEDIANLLGYRNKSSCSLIESGKAKASVEDLEKICDFFGVSMDRLVKEDLSKGVGLDGKIE